MYYQLHLLRFQATCKALLLNLYFKLSLYFCIVMQQYVVCLIHSRDPQLAMVPVIVLIVAFISLFETTFCNYVRIGIILQNLNYILTVKYTYNRHCFPYFYICLNFFTLSSIGAAIYLSIVFLRQINQYYHYNIILLKQ